MPDRESNDVLQKVRKALGHTTAPGSVPPPPVIDESFTRLIRVDADLAQAFIKTATEARLKVQQVAEADAAGRIAESVKLHQCHRVGISESLLFDRLGLVEALRSVGVQVEMWGGLSLDAAYELECGITNVWAAVAETGSLVIRPDPHQGRALSLVPPLHIAVVEPGQIVPDLIDLFARMGAEARFPNTTLVTGPSKTADIEGSLVTGVHGPGIVEVYLLK
jgi:L-lactate dehydrogenase complex protein LldG